MFCFHIYRSQVEVDKEASLDTELDTLSGAELDDSLALELGQESEDALAQALDQV